MTVISVANEIQLNQAIATIDAAASGSFVIELTADIALGTDTGQNITYGSQTLSAPAELYALNLKNGVTATIDGQNHTLDGSIGGYKLFRGLFVYAGNVTVQNLTIQNTNAVGGDGFNGGGGGAGLGGGLYVADDVADGAASAGNVTLDNVTFANNQATGGTTDFYQNVPTVVSGGGGGLGGLDGSGVAHSVGHNGGAFQGGGGIGSTADGGNVQSIAYGGIVLGAASAGAGVNNAGQTAGTGGAFGGGGGGTPGPGDSSFAGGGGGIGGHAASSLTQGGAGGYGGGGGEAAAGGFGGGGGSGGSDTGNAGGNGGFGGGGGGSKTKGGTGGFGAGNGSSTQEYTGGGGLGAGGAIFVQQGASITYKGGSVAGGSVTGGAGATAGSAYGSGIFLQGNETITFAPTLGETLTVSSDITDQTSSGGTGANAGAGQILIAGAGVVKLTGNVHVAGGVSIGGTLAASALGTNPLTLNGGTILNDTNSYVIVPNAITIQSGGGTIDANSKTVFVTGALSGSGPLLLKSSGAAGTVELQGDDHLYTGAETVASTVTLIADSANALGSGSALILHGNLDLHGLNQTIGSLAGEGTIYNEGPADAVLTVGGDGSSTSFSGQFDNLEGANVALVKAGAGIFTLSGSDALADGVTINGGTLAFNPAADLTITGAIGGSGALQKLGTHTLFLSGTQTYGGPTTVFGGRLVELGAASSAVTVKSGASLGGNGTVGATTIESGGTLLPGTSSDPNTVGTLRTGSLALKQGSTLAVNLNGDAAGQYDEVKVTGTVDITGATLALNSSNGYLDSITPGTSFTLIDNDGADAVTGVFANEDAKGEVVIAPNAPLSAVTQAYAVNTHGGDGNDVVLTEINTQPNIYQVPGAQTVASGSTLAFTGAASIQEADADQGQTVTATLSVTHGTLSTSGSSAVHSGDGTATVTITGEAFAVSNTLGTLTYRSSAGFGGNDSLSITVKDDSGASNDTASAAVALSVTGTSTYVEPFAASQVSAVINPNGSLTLAAPNATTTLNGVSTVQFNDATETVSGNTLTLYNGDGSVRVATFNITGQSYTGTVYTYDASGQLVSARYNGLTGQGYQAFETDYSNGTNTQTQYFYTGITGQPYTTETLTVNAAGQQTAVAFGGFTSAPYASDEYDFASGLFAGLKFTYTAVPAGATYSSYETDYNFASAYLGAKFFYTNITGQSYTGEEVDTDPAGATNRVLLTGYTGQPYQTLELDYTAGAYTGYKTFASNIKGQSYTGLEEDVTAAGQLTKVVYTGLKSTPYTTLEQDYTGGALSSSTFTFKAPAGQTYSSYSVTQNAAGTQISETVNNTNGSHTIVGSADGLIFEAIGNDKIKGGGSGETFDFSTVFGHDTITDFSGHTTGTGHDTIALSTADFTSFAAVSASAQNVTGGVAFTGKSGSQITLQGLDKTTLAGLGGDFTFHA